MKVACFSVAAMDFFRQQNKQYALNPAIRFCQMGNQSAFVGALGTDEAGDRIDALLQARSVDVSHLHQIEGRTACNKIINDDFGERYGIDGIWEGGVYEEFILEESDWSFSSEFDVWSTHANGPSYLNASEKK